VFCSGALFLSGVINVCLSHAPHDPNAFGEAQSRVVLSVQPDDVEQLEAVLGDHDGVRAHRLGTVTSGGLRIAVGGTTVVEAEIESLAEPYTTTIPDAVAQAS